MNTNEQTKLETLGHELVDDVELGRRIIEAYRTGGKAAALALLPEVIHEVQEDFVAVSEAAPVIKSGWRTTEFWLVALFIVGNLAFTAWRGVAIPTEVNAAVGAVLAAYVAVRGVVKAKAATNATQPETLKP